MSGPFTFNGIAVTYLGSNLSYFCAIFPVCPVSFLSCLSFGLIGYTIPFFFTTNIYGVLGFYSLKVTLKTTDILTFWLACLLAPLFFPPVLIRVLPGEHRWLIANWLQVLPLFLHVPPIVWTWCSYHQGAKDFSTSWVWAWPCGLLWSMGCQQKWKRPPEHWGLPLPAAGKPFHHCTSELGLTSQLTRDHGEGRPCHLHSWDMWEWGWPRLSSPRRVGPEQKSHQAKPRNKTRELF